MSARKSLGNMKSRRSTCITATVLFSAVAILLALTGAISTAAAQQSDGLLTGAVAEGVGAPSSEQSVEVNSGVNDPKPDVRYTVTQIPVLPGLQHSFLPILGTINNGGAVAGYSYNGDFGGSQNFYLTAVPFIGENGGIEALPLLSGWPGAFAFGLTDNKQVFGVANKLTSSNQIEQTPVLWDGDDPINLGALLPGTSAVNDVNNRGEVVGYYVTGQFATPFVWYKGQTTPLPLLPGAVGGSAVGINDTGQITGFLNFFNIPPPGTAKFHSVLWTPQAGSYSVVDLGTFGGNGGSGERVNNLGQVTGYATNEAGFPHAYLWNGGPLQDLGLLPGGTSSEALSINQKGQIVGIANRADHNVVVFLWENGVMTDINSLVPPGTPLLTEPGGINDQGEIAAFAGGAQVSFVLTPVH